MRQASSLFLHLLIALLAVAAPTLGEMPERSVLTVADVLELEDVGDPRISPDGKSILFTREWVNKMEDRWQSEIWIMDADGSRKRFLTRGSSARWSADGRRLAFLAGGNPAGTQIHVLWLDAGLPTQITRVTETPGDLRWSPDGSRIAFTMRTAGDEAWKLSAGLDRTPQDLHWAADGSGVYFTAGDRGARNVYFAPLRGEVRQLTEGAHLLSVDSVAESGLAAGVLSAPHQPGDVVTLELPEGGPLVRRTAVNDDLLGDRRLGEVEEIWYRSVDGTRIRGWIVKPPDFAAGEKPG